MVKVKRPKKRAEQNVSNNFLQSYLRGGSDINLGEVIYMGKRKDKYADDEIKVINVMADGTVCEDLTTYLAQGHQLPEVARRLVVSFIELGYKHRTEQGDC